MATKEPKIIRQEKVTLTEWDKHILRGLMTVITLVKRTLEQAERNITNHLGVMSVERFGFPEDVDVQFSDFNIEDGKVTITQYEETNDPKETGESPSGSSDGAGNSKAKQPSAKGKAASEA